MKCKIILSLCIFSVSFIFFTHSTVFGLDFYGSKFKSTKHTIKLDNPGMDGDMNDGQSGSPTDSTVHYATEKPNVSRDEEELVFTPSRSVTFSYGAMVPFGDEFKQALNMEQRLLQFFGLSYQTPFRSSIRTQGIATFYFGIEGFANFLTNAVKPQDQPQKPEPIYSILLLGTHGYANISLKSFIIAPKVGMGFQILGSGFSIPESSIGYFMDVGLRVTQRFTSYFSLRGEYSYIKVLTGIQNRFHSFGFGIGVHF